MLFFLSWLQSRLFALLATKNPSYVHSWELWDKLHNFFNACIQDKRHVNYVLNCEMQRKEVKLFLNIFYILRPQFNHLFPLVTLYPIKIISMQFLEDDIPWVNMKQSFLLLESNLIYLQRMRLPQFCSLVKKE